MTRARLSGNSPIRYLTPSSAPSSSALSSTSPSLHCLNLTPSNSSVSKQCCLHYKAQLLYACGPTQCTFSGPWNSRCQSSEGFTNFEIAPSHVYLCAVSGSVSSISVSNQHIPEQYPSNVRNCAASFVQYPSVPKLKVCRAAVPTDSSGCPLRVSNAMRKALGIQASPKSHQCLQICAPWEPIAHLGTRATSCLPDFRPVCWERTRLSSMRPPLSHLPISASRPLSFHHHHAVCPESRPTVHIILNKEPTPMKLTMGT